MVVTQARQGRVRSKRTLLLAGLVTAGPLLPGSDVQQSGVRILVSVSL